MVIEGQKDLLKNHNIFTNFYISYFQKRHVIVNNARFLLKLLRLFSQASPIQSFNYFYNIVQVNLIP